MTIIEVLIALAIIGVVFAALAALQVSNLRVTRAANQDTNRLELAVRCFEAVKREIEVDFVDYIDVTNASFSSKDYCTSPSSSYTVSITGRPWVQPQGESDFQASGMVLVDITVEDDAGSLRFRQYVSCLEMTNETRPSVMDPPTECLPEGEGG